MANEQQQDKRTASQKLEDIEGGLINLYQTVDNMARDLMTAKEAIKLLGNKSDAICKAILNGEKPSDEVISRIMVENNVSELKEKVQKLVSDGVLEAAEEISPNSFVVGRELAEDGTIQNPRMQFVVSALGAEIKDKFPGNKIGQVVNVQEGKWNFEIQEIYNIVTPPAPSEAADPAEETLPPVLEAEVLQPEATSELASATPEEALPTPE